jgi:glycosyltransferase involved in cell wall biosynthesis
MGKKGKASVSIVTVTQIKRQSTIKITADLIRDQTYKNIIEWVIVEGSKNLQDCLENEKFIKMLESNLPIVYIPGYHLENGVAVFNDNRLGALRNLGNAKCLGDITVCMDDDDYYPPTRVKHCVDMLKYCLIAGCSGKYLYDYDLERLVYFKQFSPNHSTNDCMAWRREYLESNSHDSTKEMAEEASFTKNFTNQMVQLDRKHCIIASSHSQNTFSKKEIVINGHLLANPLNPQDGFIYPMIIHPQEKVTDIIPESYYKRYLEAFKKEVESNYDIVYYCGGTSIEWDPTSQSLGGSEQAIVEICTNWVSLGYRVAVYSRLTQASHYNGIDFMDWKQFPFNVTHNVVILWRMSGINCGLQFPIKTRKLFVDFHDNNFVFRHPYLPFVDKIDKIFFKSKFHLEYYQRHFKTELNIDRYAIVPNGLRVNRFKLSPQVKREPFRFCYCSCYTRGLMPLLQFVWPLIFKAFPQAELHVYYGMNGLDQQLKQNLMFLMGQPGVMDHGRRNVEEIIVEKWRSSFHLYITECEGEIDCISIRESLITGCIPLISKSNVFQEREGIHFDIQQGYEKIANSIINVLTKPEFIEMCRERFAKSETIVDWNTVARQWEKYFN